MKTESSNKVLGWEGSVDDAKQKESRKEEEKKGKDGSCPDHCDGVNSVTDKVI